MCGITGIFSKNNKPISRDLLGDMTELLKHRGPDGQGIFLDGSFGLGHTRLSIIDIDGGAQPMANEDGSLVIVFNGEIYNYIELRQELSKKHIFKSNSDTEVILHLYEEYGIEMFSRLNGMFAIAIADLNQRKLVLGRDRLGQKPLFYYVNDDWVIFASELKSLIKHPDVPGQLDQVAAYDYFSLNYIPGNRTLLKNILSVCPGGWMIFSEDNQRSGKYWDVSSFFGKEEINDEEAALEQLDVLLEDSVRLRLRSDVPVGIFLSGGVDSSLIASKVKELGANVTAYTAIFKDGNFSEEPFAKEVAKILDMELKVFEIDPNPNLFETLVRHADDPLADSSCFPFYQLSQMTAENVKVVLGGDGADELFAGYLTYPATRLAAKIKKYLPNNLIRLADFTANLLPLSDRKVSFEYKLKRFARGLSMPPGLAHFFWNGTWAETEKKELFSQDFFAANPDIKGTYEYLNSRYAVEKAKPALASLQTVDISEYMVKDILTKVDRMSMANGLEVRSPWLDHRLVEWAAKLSPELKLRKGKCTKYLLKRYAAKKFPSRIANRSKQGFSIPVHDWIRGPLKPMADELLSPQSVDRLGFLQPQRVHEILNMHLQKRKQFGFELWGMMVLVMWHRMFMTSDNEI
ncbi:asparagine synthase (glutamine-hydrolyzing) [Planctomycetota bacterium]